jgi:hypothetical protein
MVQFAKAFSDPEIVATIELELPSPGGAVPGTFCEKLLREPDDDHSIGALLAME